MACPGSNHTGNDYWHDPFQGRKTFVIALLITALFLYGPYGWCFMRGEPLEQYGLRWILTHQALRESLIATTITLIALTPVAMAWPSSDLPRSVELRTVLHLIGIGASAAVVEEIFFRGWLQTLLSFYLKPQWAIPLTAALFALTHLILKVHWLRVATFFPGLVMGILRHRHGSVAPSALYHLFGNIWAIWFFPDMPV